MSKDEIRDAQADPDELKSVPDNDDEAEEETEDSTAEPKDTVPVGDPDAEKKLKDKQKQVQPRQAVLTNLMGFRFFDPEPRSYNPDTREADAVISTGAAVRRKDFWTDDEWDERLDMSPNSIRLERLNNGAPLLDSHQWHGGIDSMIGAVVPGSARVENGKLVARIRFSQASEKGKRIAQDLRDGIPIHLSAGYKTYREVRDTTTSPETRTAVDWEPLEVSVAPIPAEGGGAGFRELEQHEMLRSRALPIQKEATMVDKTSQGDAGGSGKDPGVNVNEAEVRAQVEKTERERVSEILAICGQGKLSMEHAQRAIAEGKSVEDYRKEAFNELAQRSIESSVSGANAGSADPQKQQNHQVAPNGRIEFGYDEADGRGEAMVEAMTVRILASQRLPAITSEKQAQWAEQMGRQDQVKHAWRIYDGHEKPTHQRATQYMRMGWAELAAECIGYRGNIRNAAQAEQVLARAWGYGGGWMARAASPASLSTSDFPAIFQNVLNKVLLARYQLAMPTYREIAVERPFNDFRPHPQVRAGDFPQLQALSETGEIRSGNSQDLSESVSVVPYGVQFPISRQMIVNDDLGAIDQILGSAGDTVLVFENVTFFTMFNANPTLNQDSTAVFASGHSNLAGSGSAPSVASIGAARAALRAMKSLGGFFLNVPPAILLSGPTQETAIDQMITQIAPTLTTSVNPFAGRLRAVADANITGTEWYLAAEPGRVPCFVYGFLAGATGPRVRTEEPFGMQGVRVSLEHDFGVGAIDYRGFYKNPGA